MYKYVDLFAILIVQRIETNNIAKEFMVYRECVRQTLVWLQKNHLYYKNIIIDDSAIQEVAGNGVHEDLPNIHEYVPQQINDTHLVIQLENDDYNSPL